MRKESDRRLNIIDSPMLRPNLEKVGDGLVAFNAELEKIRSELEMAAIKATSAKTERSNFASNGRFFRLKCDLSRY
jgi:hypothetical protein